MIGCYASECSWNPLKILTWKYWFIMPHVGDIDARMKMYVNSLYLMLDTWLYCKGNDMNSPWSLCTWMWYLNCDEWHDMKTMKFRGHVLSSSPLWIWWNAHDLNTCCSLFLFWDWLVDLVFTGVSKEDGGIPERNR